MVKMCIKCNTEKDEILFVLNRNYCRECFNSDNRKRKEAKLNAKKKDQPIINIQIDAVEKTKKCTKCDIEKKESSYYKGRQYCKDCANSIRKEKYAENPDVIANREIMEEEKKIQDDKIRKQFSDKKKIDDEEKKLLDDGKRKCEYCDKITSVTNFRHNRQKCGDCERKNGRDFRQTDTGKEKAKTWVNGNKERMTELQYDYFLKHKDDPVYKLKQSELSKLSHMQIPNFDGQISTCVGCSSKFLQKWMNHCFTEEMELDNHGTVWQNDHVIPISKFNILDEDQCKLCFNWRNVMPLSEKDNLAKKNKIDTEQIKKHYTNLKEFHKIHNIEIPKEFQELYAKHLITPGNPLEL